MKKSIIILFISMFLVSGTSFAVNLHRSAFLQPLFQTHYYDAFNNRQDLLPFWGIPYPNLGFKNSAGISISLTDIPMLSYGDVFSVSNAEQKTLHVMSFKSQRVADLIDKKQSIGDCRENSNCISEQCVGYTCCIDNETQCGINTCGVYLGMGNCVGNQTCEDGICTSCTPNLVDCGDDGCGNIIDCPNLNDTCNAGVCEGGGPPECCMTDPGCDSEC